MLVKVNDLEANLAWGFCQKGILSGHYFSRIGPKEKRSICQKLFCLKNFPTSWPVKKWRQINYFSPHHFPYFFMHESGFNSSVNLNTLFNLCCSCAKSP